MDRQAGSEPGDQSIKQTYPKRGRQRKRNPRYSPRSKHRVIRLMVNIQIAGELGKTHKTIWQRTDDSGQV